MQALTPTRNTLSLAIALALLAAVPAMADDATQTKGGDAKVTGPNLDAIVVTGTSERTTVMKSSVSLSVIDDEQIARSGATNAAELLRSIPGIRAESSGGEGNANVTVRGVPISAGGGRYVQFQEDGLPVMLFGDMNFGTADEFLRVDGNVDHVEVVRGGSASTLASDAPGGIINFVSKTGEEKGGAVGFTTGVNFRENRYDFDYGSRIGDSTRFHFGGFFRDGDGIRNPGYQAESGGQIKGNLTEEFSSGYVRLNVKLLNDHTPTYLPSPVGISGGSLVALPGLDPRTVSQLGPNLANDTTIDSNGHAVTTSTRSGLHTEANSLGGEAHFDLGNGFIIDDKLRETDASGRFIGMFVPPPSAAQVAAQSYPGVLFNTSLNDLGSTFNDLRLSKKLEVADVKANVTGGLFMGNQNIAETWDWNTYQLSLANRNPTAVQTGTGATTFGGCCVRDWNTRYTNTSPYLNLTAEQGALTVDGSVRRDRQHAQGYQHITDGLGNGLNFNKDAGKIDYSLSRTSYSVGGNYQLDKDLALFARTSRGYSFFADRLLYGTPLDGSAPINVGEVHQHELGVKYRQGAFSVFLTGFIAQTSESNYEVTTQTSTQNTYDARGVEVEAGYRMGDFHINGGATFTDAQITGALDPTVIGHTPRRQAKYIFQVSPGYSVGPFDLGAQVYGTGDSYTQDDNLYKMPAYVSVNAFVYYQFDEHTRFALTANNLFNTIGFTEAEGVGAGSTVTSARSIDGRTVRASVRYTF